MKKPKKHRHTMFQLIQIMEDHGNLEWVKVVAIPYKFEDKEFIKKFGFTWDKIEKVWYVWMEPDSFFSLERSSSQDKVGHFEVRMVECKFEDKAIIPESRLVSRYYREEQFSVTCQK